MRVLIVGDSLALPRPYRIKEFNPLVDKELAVHYQDTYGHLIQEHFDQFFPNKRVIVINRAQRFNTIKNIYEQIVDHTFFFEPDVLIMHVGIVDCWFRDELNGRQLVNIVEFESYYKKIIQVLKSRKQTKLIILGIAPTSKKMEERYPGILKEIIKYNIVLKSSIDNKQFFYTDFHSEISADDPQKYLLPDDHHLNKHGNKLAFKKLIVILEALITNSLGYDLYKEKRLDEAYSHFKKSFDRFPIFSDNLYNLLIMAIEKGDILTVKEIMSIVVKHKINDSEILNLVDIVYGKYISDKEY